MKYKRNQIVYKISQDGDTIAQGRVSNPRYIDFANEYIQVSWAPSGRLSYYNLKGGPYWDSIVIICDVGVTI